MPTERLGVGISAIRIGVLARSRDEAIEHVGQALVETGAADPKYVQEMHERECLKSTYVGGGIAIPHGGARADHVRKPGLVVVKFLWGVDWGGHEVHTCIGIAASGLAHIGVLRSVASILTDPSRTLALREASDADMVLDLLEPAGTRPKLWGED